MLRSLWRRSSTSIAFSNNIRPRLKMSSTTGEKILFGPFEVTTQVFLETRYSFALVNLKPLLPGHVLVCPRQRHRRLTDLSMPELTDLFSTVQRVQRMLARQYFVSATSSASLNGHSSSHNGAAGDSSSPSSSPPPPASSSPSPPSSLEAGGSFNIALQDGPEAGQTVAHVHVHVIPRPRESSTSAEPGQPDELYIRMAAEDGNVGGALWDSVHSSSSTPATAAAKGKCGEKRPVPGGGFAPIEDADRTARSMAEMEAEADIFRGLLREIEEEEEEEEEEAKMDGR